LAFTSRPISSVFFQLALSSFDTVLQNASFNRHGTISDISRAPYKGDGRPVQSTAQNRNREKNNDKELKEIPKNSTEDPVRAWYV